MLVTNNAYNQMLGRDEEYAHLAFGSTGVPNVRLPLYRSGVI